jgi:hypothetical protein
MPAGIPVTERMSAFADANEEEWYHGK